MAHPLISREEIEDAFLDLGRAAAAAGKVIDLAVYGGAALLLTLPARPATRDVDAVAASDPEFVRETARDIAALRGWPPDWLNDAVKGYLSERQSDADSMRLFRTYPSETKPGLRVYVARPEYLLAMKCIAMGLDAGEASRDVDDIRALVRELRLADASQVLDLFAEYYPRRRIPPKTQFGVEEIMQTLSGGRQDDAKT